MRQERQFIGMHLDSLTFMVSNVLATAFACISLFGAWTQLRRSPALLWWAGAHAINAVGLGILIAGLVLPDPLLTVFALGSMTIAPPMIWAGVERFNNRHVFWPVFIAGPAVWLAVLLVPFDFENQKWAALVELMSWTLYLLFVVVRLWSTRSEKLTARWPLMGLLGVHAVIFLGAGYEQLAGTLPPGAPPMLFSWFGMINFEGIFYAGGSALLMILLCRERIEREIIEAAETDNLTGAANRNTFFEGAERMLERCRRKGTPFSLIMFDLDKFKEINDSHGHQMGDRILASFAKTVRASLRPNDLFGRYGGEEFTVALPDASMEAAFAIAERIRRAFAERHRFVDGLSLNATVSAGVASAPESFSLKDLIASADRAMYVAKSNGRNRVEGASTDNLAGQPSNLVRIA